MTKSELVKIGVPPALAEGMKRLRRIRQILEQHDLAVARLNATTDERIRAAVTETEESPAEATLPLEATLADQSAPSH